LTASASHDTHVLLAAFAEELGRCGIAAACTSPGSRCAPLVRALTAEPALTCYSHLDERCAGFFALGHARATGTPVAVTCTSGTAAAELAPAVIEAWEGCVPLIVLTADRPPELRDTGAGQAIDQLKLYGTAVKWFFEVGDHPATAERVRWMRTLACRAFAAASAWPPGPVHLNFPLREPLVPTGPVAERAPGRPDGRPWLRLPAAPVWPGAAADHAERLEHASRPLLVAGDLGARGSEAWASAAGALARVAERTGAPLLADPLSGARRGTAAIAHYDLLLRCEEFAAAHVPDVVLRLGDLPTSKPLRRWLADLPGVEQLAVVPGRGWPDPDGVLDAAVAADVGAGIVEAMAELVGDDPSRPPPATEWLESWRAADRNAAAALGEVLESELSEPGVARLLAEHLPAGSTLWVASSMPIRDVEAFWPPTDRPVRMLANRGANGIDGTVSSAFGAAAASRGPVVALVGDVALAHDLGGLLAATRLSLSLIVVAINNDGGGIFEFLPVAGQEAFYEQHVATPHGLDFAGAAELYRLHFERPTDLDALARSLDDALARRSSTLIEVRTGRHENRELHARCEAAVCQALAPPRG